MSALNSHEAQSLEGYSSLDKFSSIREVEEEQQESLVGNSQKRHGRRTSAPGSKPHHFEMDVTDLQSDIEEHKHNHATFSKRKRQLDSLMAIEETKAGERKNGGQNSLSTIRTKESSSTKGAVKVPKLTLPHSSSRQRTASAGKE